jgi:hypothetical protein
VPGDMTRIPAMMKELTQGQWVTVIAYGGESLQRVVVNDLGRTVIVCTEQEFHSAQQENREPDGVGFPRKDVHVIP